MVFGITLQTNKYDKTVKIHTPNNSYTWTEMTSKALRQGPKNLLQEGSKEMVTITFSEVMFGFREIEM